LKVSRLTKLAEPVRLELIVPDELTGKLKADAVTVPVGTESAVVRVTPTTDLRGLTTFSIRATAIQEGKYPVISETPVTVELQPPGTGVSAPRSGSPANRSRP